MTHTPERLFLVLEEGIINIGDISTVLPYTEHVAMASGPVKGLRVTMQSKGTHVDLPGMTVEGFASLLNGAVF